MIDWEFIAEQEGGSLTATVPDPEGSASGATFQGGLDVANMGPGAWAALPNDLQARLQPYRLLKGQAAADFVAANPITISVADRDAMQSADATLALETITARFLEDSSGIEFNDIADAAQTIIVSVSWQYGVPWADPKCGSFWQYAVTQNWSAEYAELQNFVDKRYISRRRREAAYLRLKLNL